MMKWGNCCLMKGLLVLLILADLAGGKWIVEFYSAGCYSQNGESVFYQRMAMEVADDLAGRLLTWQSASNDWGEDTGSASYGYSREEMESWYPSGVTYTLSCIRNLTEQTSSETSTEEALFSTAEETNPNGYVYLSSYYGSSLVGDQDDNLYQITVYLDPEQISWQAASQYLDYHGIYVLPLGTTGLSSQMIFQMRYLLLALELVGLLALAGCLLLLVRMIRKEAEPGIGEQAGEKTTRLPFLLWLPLELYLLGSLLVLGLILLRLRAVLWWYDLAESVFWSVVGLYLVISILVNLCCRARRQTLWSNTLIAHLGGGGKGLLRNLIWLWKPVLGIGLVGYLWIRVALIDSGRLRVLITLVLTVLFAAAACLLMDQLVQLQRAMKRIAEGEENLVIDTRRLLPVFRRQALRLRELSSGINQAVEEKLRSERRKTELITNVSHDIKTPLTSIINYADLISREETEDPELREYTGILLERASQLKRLIENLIEASKASTGNIRMELVVCDLRVLLEQSLGEYQQRLEQRELEVVLRLPDHPVNVLADGRQLWRVLDTLLDNICRYALSKTRVYVQMEMDQTHAEVVFCNVSDQPLDMTPQELMQQAVSSQTQGSGLGLSIAQSLMNSQGGSLKLTIDGDLLKAAVQIPLAKGGEREKTKTEKKEQEESPV